MSLWQLISSNSPQNNIPFITVIVPQDLEWSTRKLYHLNGTKLQQHSQQNGAPFDKLERIGIGLLHLISHYSKIVSHFSKINFPCIVPVNQEYGLCWLPSKNTSAKSTLLYASTLRFIRNHFNLKKIIVVKTIVNNCLSLHSIHE